MIGFKLNIFQKKSKKFMGNKNIITNNYTIQFDNVWKFCIGFIEFMLKGKRLLYCTNLFSSNEYEKNKQTDFP